MIGMSASSPDGIKPVDVAPHDASGGDRADDWMLRDTSESEASDLSDTAESMAVHADEPARDTIPSPPPENGVEATPVTIPAPPPLGDFELAD